VESLGYPELVRGVSTSVAATWTFQAGCNKHNGDDEPYDGGSIRLDRVSSACQVVEKMVFVGSREVFTRASTKGILSLTV